MEGNATCGNPAVEYSIIRDSCGANLMGGDPLPGNPMTAKKIVLVQFKKSRVRRTSDFFNWTSTIFFTLRVSFFLELD